MGRWQPVARLEQLPDGTGHEVVVDGRVVALFRAGGQVYAIDGRCPHQGRPLAGGSLDGYTLTCPWHGWQVDVRTGWAAHDPSYRQKLYEVKVEGEEVYLWRA